jgi:hypothetical protein
MAITLKISASLNTTVISNPTNYNEVTVSWPALSADVTWNKVKLVRNTSGYPKNIWDGVDITPADAVTSGFSIAHTVKDTITASGVVKAYYTLFGNFTGDVGGDTDKYWKPLGTSASIVVYDTGLTNVIWNHIPRFYREASQVGSSNDLEDFLSLFAFHLEMYKAQASNVFNSSDAASVDEVLLKLYLKEFGSDFTDVNDVSQARVLLNNLIKIYKQSGSLVGMETAVEAYTGYGVNIYAGKNLMPDYNSSSFEETSGFWNLTTGYAATQSPTITSNGPVIGSVTAFTDGAYTTFTGPSITSASCATTTTTITGTFTTAPAVGSLLTLFYGTGVLATGTVVTSILGTNSIRVNKPPTTALSGATLFASTNMVSGMGKVTSNSTAATTATFRLGPKRTTAEGAFTSTNVITVLPSIASVNDYVIHPNIPTKTYVVSSTTVVGGQSLTLSNKVSGTVSSASTVTFSSNSLDATGSYSSWLHVEAGVPYTFSMFVNPGAITSGTTSCILNWYKRDGSSAGTSASGTNSSKTFSSGTANKWNQIIAQGTAPTDAVYAEPSFSITGVASTTTHYVDAAQFTKGASVVKKKVVSLSTITLTTSSAHGFNIITDTGLTNYVTVTGVGTGFDGTWAISEVTSNTITYTGGTSANVAETTATGYASACSKYEDARLIYVNVQPTRKNLLTNTSFRSPANTDSWTVTSSQGTTTLTTATTISTLISSMKVDTYSATSTTMTTVVNGYVYNSVTSSANSTITVATPTINNPQIPYTFSFDFSGVYPTAQTVTAQIVWSDSSVTTGTPVDVTTDLSIEKWTRVSVTGYVPTGVTSATVRIIITNNSAVSGHSYHYIRFPMFEQSSVVNPYFDGYFDGQTWEDTRDSIFEINGSPGYCPSYLYSNRVNNQGRLKSIITDGVYYA